MSYVTPFLSSISDKSEMVYDFSLPYILKASYLYIGYVAGNFMIYNLVMPAAPYVAIMTLSYSVIKINHKLNDKVDEITYKVYEKIKSLLYDTVFSKEVGQDTGVNTCDNDFCLEEIGKVGVVEAEL